MRGSELAGWGACPSFNRVRVAAVLLSCLVSVTAGCGSATRVPLHPRSRPGREPAVVARHTLTVIVRDMRAPEFSGHGLIRFKDIQYELLITNAGSPDAFTAHETVATELTVMPDSSARAREQVLAPPRLATRIDRLHWQASGRRPYASHSDDAGASSHSKLPAGAFSFTPQGIGVTFWRVRHLPMSPQALSHVLTGLLTLRGRPAPPGAVILRQYGFLLAAAPLTRSERKAVLEAIGSLPGVHTCARLFVRDDPQGDAFCVDGDPTGTEVVIDPRTGVALVVGERLDDLTPLYPNMVVGSVVDADSFTLQVPGSRGLGGR